MKRGRDDAEKGGGGVYDDARYARFREWCDAVGIVTNDDAIEVRSLVDHTAGGGGGGAAASSSTTERRHYAVFAKRDLNPDETVFTVPKSATLCAANSVTMGPRCARGELGGGLALNAAAMYELGSAVGREEGGAMRFDGFAAILPIRGERTLPMFWDESLLKELRGTELAEHLEEDEDNFKEDWETAVEALELTEAELASGDFSLERFKEVASIAASRAFYVGGKYGECLVPCADLFNHRTGENSVAVYGVEDEEDSDEDEAFPDDDEEEEDDDGCLVIKTVKKVKAGDELFNTFGTQSNASLLHKYGFCETHNVDTATVTLDVSLFEAVYGKSVMESVYEALKTAEVDSDLLEFFECGKYYEVSHDGAIDDEFTALVTAMTRCDAPPLSDDSVENITIKIIDARLARYGDLGDLDEELSESGKPPAGGGVILREAARLVRRQEVELLRAARKTLLL